jgi:16S rRNA (cytosine967-C5)-methyltransferase
MKHHPAKNPSPPSARAAAATLLADMLGARRTLDEALAQHPLIGSDADQKFTRMLVLTTLRHVGQIDALLKTYLDKPLPPKRVGVTNGLRLGVVQLLLLKTPAHAAVNETVHMVKRGRDGALAGLVNAILQKINREQPALPPANHNLPSWLKTRWEKAYGTVQVGAMAEVASNRPPLDINSASAMKNATRIDCHMLRLPADHDAVETLEGYANGAFFVQDVAASYPARLLGDVRGLQVLDVGAAPGGKTAQLAQAGAYVTALDRSAPRMEVLKTNMARLGHAVETVVADALSWQPPQPFDAILLDAPCSATGTWRRHPEVVHITTMADVNELAATQRAMLTRAWRWLKPGGKLVYCVCSLEPEEGEAQASWFLANHADAALVPVDATSEIPAECIANGTLRTLPSHMATAGGMDGFFAACFAKTA